ncbi:hypothetical protein KCP74_03620 [Salmonella enterica subsp. enterica]|nr:hypothetical protein KCP74_03620 [Salmonella enterica subsp. enterica]
MAAGGSNNRNDSLAGWAVSTCSWLTTTAGIGLAKNRQDAVEMKSAGAYFVRARRLPSAGTSVFMRTAP